MNNQLVEHTVFVVRLYNVNSKLFMSLCADTWLLDPVRFRWVSNLSTTGFMTWYRCVANSVEQSHVRKCLRCHLLAISDWWARYMTSCWGSIWRPHSSYRPNGRLSSYSSCFHATSHLLTLVLLPIVSPLLELIDQVSLLPAQVKLRTAWQVGSAGLHTKLMDVSEGPFKTCLIYCYPPRFIRDRNDHEWR